MAIASTRINLSPFSNTSILKPRPLTPFKIKPVSYPPQSANPNLSGSLSIDNGGNNDNVGGGGVGKGGGGSGGHDGNSSSGGGGGGGLDPMATLVEGYRSRVAADPDFPIKVVMEELAAAAAAMATRPNFGLGELGSVVPTLVVGSLGSFALLNRLAPTLTLTSSSTSLPSYIFEPGPFPLSARLARLFYKGLIFAAVGFASGLAGTAISNGLVTMRRKKEKDAKKKKKKGPKAVLNAAVSSNLRCIWPFLCTSYAGEVNVFIEF